LNWNEHASHKLNGDLLGPGEIIMKRICVALLTPYPPIRDGIAFYSEQLSEALQSIGVEVHVLTWATASNFFADQDKMRVIKVSSPTKLGFKSSVIEAVSRLSPDLVHVQYSFKRGLYGWALGEQLLPVLYAVHRLDIPIVMTIHDIWSRSDIFARFGKSVVTITKAIAYYAYLCLVAKFVFRHVNAVIVHSDYLTDLLHKEYNVKCEKLFVANHGIPNYQLIDKATAKLMIDIKAEHVLLNFGKIWEGKKLEHLIQVMQYVVKEIPDAHLIIAGPPSQTNGAQYVEKLRSLTKRVGLEQCVSIRAGFIKEDRIPFYFSAASLVIVPYPYSTGASGVVSLAFAFEKPVVAGLNPLRIDELGLGNNARGMLAPLDDPHQLANTITRLFRDKELYEKLRKNIKAFKIGTSWKNVATRTSEIYKKVLQSPNFGNS